MKILIEKLIQYIRNLAVAHVELVIDGTKYLIHGDFWKFLVQWDMYFNALLMGDPQETLSSRMGKHVRHECGGWHGWISYWTCRALHILDKNHCQKYIMEHEGDDAVSKVKD